MPKYYPIKDMSVLRKGMEIFCALNGEDPNFNDDSEDEEHPELDWFKATITSLSKEGNTVSIHVERDDAGEWYIQVTPENLSLIQIAIRDWDD